MSKSRKFDTKPSPVTGQALHVRPQGGPGGPLFVAISYPVAVGGKGIETREVAVVLSAEDRAALAAFLAAPAGPHPFSTPDGNKTYCKECGCTRTAGDHCPDGIAGCPIRHEGSFTDRSAAYERSNGTDPALWDAAGEFERLRTEGMTADQAGAFMRNGGQS